MTPYEKKTEKKLETSTFSLPRPSLSSQNNYINTLRSF